MGRAQRGLQANGFTVFCHRFIHRPFRRKGDAEIVVGLSQIRLQPEGLPVSGDRLF